MELGLIDPADSCVSNTERLKDPPPPAPTAPTVEASGVPDLPDEWLLDGVGIRPEATRGGLPREVRSSASRSGSLGSGGFSPSFAEARAGSSGGFAGGSSFTLLGLDDDPGSGEYLLEYDGASRWRKWLMMAVAVALALFAVRLWQRDAAWRAAAVHAWGDLRNQVSSGNAPSVALPVPATSASRANEASIANAPAPSAVNPEAADAAPGGPADSPITAKTGEPSSPPAPASSDTVAAATGAAPRPEASHASSASTPGTARPPEADRARRGAAHAQPEPSPADRPKANTEDDALVARAQGYLHGRVGARSCSMALPLLQQVAARGNARASAQLGALYATGKCTRFDRAEAYHWFARAAEAEPTNAYLKRDCDMLWREMTPQERRRVVE